MQLYGCKLLCVILTLVCLASSQNSTPAVKTAVYGTTSPWPTGKAITMPTTLLKTAVYGTTPPWPITPTTLLNPRIVDVTASSNTLFDDIYLKCVVQGNPSPNVWWTKNGRYIQGYNIEFQDNNRTLIITRAASDDVGTYYCHARNKVSYVNAPFVLNLTYPLNTFIYTPNDYVELYNGEKDVDIRCFGAGYPNVRVTWKRNGVEILEFSNSSLNTRVYQERLKLGLTSAESDLSFKEFYCNDTGIYTCETSRDGSDYVAAKSIELKCNSSDSSQSTLFTPLSPTTIVPKPTRSLSLSS
ncbi:neural cell adhesion molecule L1 isoform X5, partial [Paramuricea clavata]